MIRYPKTDKDYPHGYLPHYDRIADRVNAKRTASSPPPAICEVGVWFGGSLEMWQSLFPGATVVGVDINPGAVWPQGTHSIVMSQDNPELAELVSEHAPGGYDLIVDDASHLAEATFRTFLMLWPLVKPGCYYVVEDWTTAQELGQWVPQLIGFLREDAATVTYTREGLVILRKVAS